MFGFYWGYKARPKWVYLMDCTRQDNDLIDDFGSLSIVAATSAIIEPRFAVYNNVFALLLHVTFIYAVSLTYTCLYRICRDGVA